MREPTLKPFENDPAAVFDSNDDIGIYAEDMHDISEVLVKEDDAFAWNGAKMTKSSNWCESAFIQEVLVLGNPWNDFDSDDTNWSAGTGVTVSNDNSIQLEGSGCLKIAGDVSNPPSATRSFAGEDWTVYDYLILPARTDVDKPMKIRIGTDASNYVEYEIDVSKNKWHNLKLEIDLSTKGMRNFSQTGTINWASIGWIQILGSENDQDIYIDLLSLHNDQRKARGNFDWLEQSTVSRGGLTINTLNHLAPSSISYPWIAFRLPNKHEDPGVFGLKTRSRKTKFRLTGLAKTSTGSQWTKASLFVDGQEIFDIQTLSTSSVSLDSGWVHVDLSKFSDLVDCEIQVKNLSSNQGTWDALTLYVEY